MRLEAKEMNETFNERYINFSLENLDQNLLFGQKPACASQ